MKKIIRAITSTFKYVEPLWLDNANHKMSLRSCAAIALITDFIINLHNSAFITVKVLNLIYKDKNVDSNLISAMAGNLAQVTMMLGIEAGLIAAMLALKYDTFRKPIEVNVPVKKEEIITNPNQQD